MPLHHTLLLRCWKTHCKFLDNPSVHRSGLMRLTQWLVLVYVRRIRMKRLTICGLRRYKHLLIWSRGAQTFTSTCKRFGHGGNIAHSSSSCASIVVFGNWFTCQRQRTARRSDIKIWTRWDHPVWDDTWSLCESALLWNLSASFVRPSRS